MNQNITLPSIFENALKKDIAHHSIVQKTLSDFGKIYEENRLYFFEEYTDHGIKHINSVLASAADLIDESTKEKFLSPANVSTLILAIILHDLGMQISFASFVSLLDGKYDSYKIEEFDSMKWSESWIEYLDEVRKFNGASNKRVFGSEDHNFKIPDLTSKDNLNGSDKKLIGEFIRRNHCRLAHEIAINGLIDKNGDFLHFAYDHPIHFRKLAGVIARSHGMNIRDTFSYLNSISSEEWATPYDVDVVFLMVVLRIADYFQIDEKRVDKLLIKFKTFSSPLSETEHEKHNSIEFVKPNSKDKETLYIEARPRNSRIYIKLRELFNDLQKELDLSWAILGEIYGKEERDKQPRIKYRRIKSNIENVKEFSKNVTYVPDKIVFTSDHELLKLLIAPLYGNHPTYAVRELVQNAVDACRERQTDFGNLGYVPEITVEIFKEKDESWFQISDNGKGMNVFEIKNYFLKAGSSFRKSPEWKKKYIDESGKSIVQRSGKFGVGALAAFLLGERMIVQTQNVNDSQGLFFEASLDDEQIEIKRVDLDRFGTIIKIQLSNEALKLLDIQDIGNHLYGKSSQMVDWTKWYTLRHPIIKYNAPFINDKSLYKSFDPGFNEQLPMDWHELKSTNYEQVLWTYSTSYTKSSLTCNGIVIPDSFEITSPIITISPKVAVFDFNGNLNLNLNRNRLSHNKPDFIKEIIVEIYKDIIACLLTVPVDKFIQNDLLILRDTKLLHPALIEYRRSTYRYGFNQLAFCNQGYTLDYGGITKYCNRKFKITIYNFLGKAGVPITTVDDLLINVNRKRFTGFNDFKDVIDPFYFPGQRGRVYIRKRWYEKLFDKSKKRVRKGLIDNHIVDFQDSNWVAFHLNYFQIGPKFDLAKLNMLSEDVQVLTECYINKGSSYDTVFDELLEKYIGSNSIIPFSLEERKKIYPIAFDELEIYMRKYLNK